MPGNANYSGQTIGNFLVLERLGYGEFGSVYRAQNKYVPERIVAIKLINEKYSSSLAECRHFIDEARMLQKVRHPHILPIFDVGEHFGVPYMVVEFAPEGSLRDYLRKYPNQWSPLNEALVILSQVGEALHHAHLQRIVHRDLKPENILFKQPGEALLADFGIAAELPTASIRQTNTITGTPPYMAPEQFQGIYSKLSDQYALGCIAYELVTGRRPFQANDFASWAFKHAQEQVIPPRQINPTLSTEVEQAILKALSKDRNQRFVDVAAFVAALTGVAPTIASGKTLIKSAKGNTALGTSDLTIGRASDNSWVLDDEEVSSHHAVIRPQGQGYTVTDLKSTNGTFVNEQRIQAAKPYLLKEGDNIRLGKTTFEYVTMPDDPMPQPDPIEPVPAPPQPRPNMPIRQVGQLGPVSPQAERVGPPTPDPVLDPIPPVAPVSLPNQAIRQSSPTPTPAPDPMPPVPPISAPNQAIRQSTPAPTPLPEPPVAQVGQFIPPQADTIPDSALIQDNRGGGFQPIKEAGNRAGRRIILTIVSMIVILGLIGGIAYAAYSAGHSGSDPGSQTSSSTTDTNTAQNTPEPTDTPTDTPTPEPTDTPTPEPTDTPTPTPTDTPTPQPSSGAIWSVAYNGSRDALTYNGYNVNDPANAHFLIVDVTVTNQTSDTQSVGGWLFALYGSDGVKYPEDQSSDPGNSTPVDASASSSQEMAFVVPNNVCTYELYFYDPSGTTYTQRIYITNQYCS